MNNAVFSSSGFYKIENDEKYPEINIKYNEKFKNVMFDDKDIEKYYNTSSNIRLSHSKLKSSGIFGSKPLISNNENSKILFQVEGKDLSDIACGNIIFPTCKEDFSLETINLKEIDKNNNSINIFDGKNWLEIEPLQYIGLSLPGHSSANYYYKFNNGIFEPIFLDYLNYGGKSGPSFLLKLNFLKIFELINNNSILKFKEFNKKINYSDLNMESLKKFICIDSKDIYAPEFIEENIFALASNFDGITNDSFNNKSLLFQDNKIIFFVRSLKLPQSKMKNINSSNKCFRNTQYEYEKQLWSQHDLVEIVVNPRFKDYIDVANIINNEELPILEPSKYNLRNGYIEIKNRRNIFYPFPGPLSSVFKINNLCNSEFIIWNRMELPNLGCEGFSFNGDNSSCGCISLEINQNKKATAVIIKTEYL